MLERTQLMLDKKVKNDLRKISRQKGKSVSKLVREYLEEGVKEDLEKKPKYNARKLLLKMASHAGKGPGDSDYDKYAYGL
jgi:predicted DNA-binding protein